MTKSMTHIFPRYSIFLLCALLVLLAGCSSDRLTGSGSPSKSVTATNGDGNSTSKQATPTVATQPVPATQTDCPAGKQGRALVTAPLAQGAHPQILYLAAAEADQYHHTLMRYDTVTHTSAVILKSPFEIYRTLLSNDGKWLLLVAIDHTHPTQATPQGISMVQAIRIDGQGLQTLYCSGALLQNVTWSPDLHWISFNTLIIAVDQPYTIQLLDTAKGEILPEVDVPQRSENSDLHIPIPLQWQSNTQLYLGDLSNNSTGNTYILDTNKGQHQKSSDLQIIMQKRYRTLLFDNSHFLLNQVQCQNQQSSCSDDKVTQSTLISTNIEGTNEQTIYQTSQLAINDVSLVNQQGYVFTANNYSAGTREIWTIKSDGSQPKKLVSTTTTASFIQNTEPTFFRTTTWTTVSPDQTQYIAHAWPTSQNDDTQIGYGSLQGGQLTLVPDSTNATAIGWALL